LTSMDSVSIFSPHWGQMKPSLPIRIKVPHLGQNLKFVTTFTRIKEISPHEK
jgi:hypothetical protein